MDRLEQNNHETIQPCVDLRGLDLSKKNLRAVPIDVLITADFDTKTIWPEHNKLPAGFNPENIIHEAKNPGLGIKELHQQGIDGRGIKVAIIDQALSSEQGNVLPHSEYVSNIIDYQEFGGAQHEEISMHGPAVASLLVGKTCGVAPGANLVYRATPSGRDFDYKAAALLDIITLNKSLPPKDRVRIVSCSIGYMNKKSEHGLENWIEAIIKAEAEGIIIFDLGARMGVDYIGGGTSGDKNNPEDYHQALFLTKEKRKGVIIPCDYRTMASNAGSDEYLYIGKGGMSWSVPYLSGLCALALQMNPKLTKQHMTQAISKTARMNKKGFNVVNPKGFIEAIQK